MISDQPYVTRPCDRLTGWFRERFFVFWRRAIAVIGQQRLQLLLGEAHEPEIEALVLQIGEFRGQDLLVPARVLGESLLSAMMYARRWVSLKWSSTTTGTSGRPNFGAASKRPWPATIPALVSTRIGALKPNSTDGGCDLRNLGVRVRASIPRVRDQAVHGPDLDAPGQRRRNGNWFLEHGVELDYFAMAVIGRPLAHVWPTLRPGAAGRPVLPGWRAGETGRAGGVTTDHRVTTSFFACR